MLRALALLLALSACRAAADSPVDPDASAKGEATRAELRLMQTLPSLGKGQKSEMLNSAMDVIKAQQQKAEEIRRKNEQQNA